MSSLLIKRGVYKNKIKIIAYKNKEKKLKKTTYNKQKINDAFLYVSSDSPHKNHKNLIEAWCLLSKDNIYPKLIASKGNKG